MNVDCAFILGAGLGTRMGPVGKVLPKLLWPVFEKTLLELQIEFAKSIGIRKVYLNTHYEAELIHQYINEKKLDIEVLHEEKLLDIGGGIHNLARRLNYQGKILILNGDQFLIQDEEHFKSFLEISEDHVATLLGLKVPFDSGYNELSLENNLLVDIKKNDSGEDYYTYSGSSIINLSKLDPSSGESKFFDTVANYKNKSVYVYNHNSLDYWDFGTTGRYFESMRRVLDEKDSTFKNFLVHSESIILEKIGEDKTYNSSGSPYSINLSSELKNGSGNILITGEDDLDSSRRGVIYGEVKSLI